MECNCNKRPFFPLLASFEANGFKHTISFRPGFACERTIANLNDGQGHGFAGVDILFVVEANQRAVSFAISTGWDPRGKAPGKKSYDVYPLADMLSYHSPVAMYEEQTSREDCKWTGGICYSGGSYSSGDEALAIFVTRGEQALWDRMEEYYKQTFTKE